MSEKNRKVSETLVDPNLATVLDKQRLDFVFYMFINVRTSSTKLFMEDEGTD